MKIERFNVGILGTNCYLVINEESKQTVVIDPGGWPSYLKAHIETEGLKIEAILLTHGHFDHTMGIDAVVEKYPVPVYIHEADEEMLRDPKANQSSTYTAGYSYDGAITVKDGQVLSLAGFQFEILHTPGHTPGGCCFYIKEENVLFSGDTLFQTSVGRTDFVGSSTSALIRGIREKLMVLPEDTLVYPGHMGETKIGYEKQNNPFI